MAVHNLIKKIKETGSTELRKGSGRPVTVTTDFWGACLFARRWTWYPQFLQANRTSDIDQQIISSSFCQKKESSLLQTFKKPQMNSTCHKRRAERAGKLLQRSSIHSLPRPMFQEEKDFSLQVPTNLQNNRVYFNGPKKYTMVAIVILSQQLMSWREEFVMFEMSVQRISPKSAEQWNSFSPDWKP